MCLRQKQEKPKASDPTCVRPLLMKSAEIDYDQLEQSVNFIYIDGDHSYEGMKRDSAKALEHILKVGSRIVWHDYVTRHQDWIKVREYLDELDHQLRSGDPCEKSRWSFATSKAHGWFTCELATKNLDLKKVIESIVLL